MTALVSNESNFERRRQQQKLMTTDNDNDDSTEAQADAQSDTTTVHAEAELTEVDTETLLEMSEEQDPLRPLADAEELDVRVVVAELAELWAKRERIRHEQPTDVRGDEEVFAEDADELAVRQFQRADEQIAQLMLEQQDLVIRQLVSDFDGVA